MKALFNNIRESFDALWNCRMRGESLEVITPFSTSSDMYVSVFITRRDDFYVITDGGWLDRGVYKQPQINSAIFEQISEFFCNDFCISRTYSNDGTMYIYKSTKDLQFIPNLVFDVANYISLMVNNSIAQYRTEPKSERFRTQARDLIKSHITSDKLRFNTYLTQQSKSAHFGAIVTSTTGHVSLVNFISGSNFENIKGSFATSNLNYDLLDRTSAKNLVKDRVVLFDDRRFQFQDLNPYVEMTRSKGQYPMMWTQDQENLINLLSA